MAADEKALQRVWVCTEAVGLVRADRIVSMTVNNWQVRGARAEEADAHGHDVLSAALTDGTRVILGHCGTLSGWRALAELATRLDGAAVDAADADDVAFVHVSVDRQGGIRWQYRVGELSDLDAWPSGPQPQPVPSAEQSRR
ncbi:hypothetical protein [Nonomuraea gerenzanensis]|uniref:hypothetical protein n=1 Tax=Nonomuraea gerenzanensis TaxID=93944 RepID=UPI00156392CA|nr:hypothetical protein [Nonomuraea gerenzanensis]UBU19207.1 hypothetical protein LCN96_56150 [Nonomuraea gerenzanensis]